MTWIRFESHYRYHAVYVATPEQVYTYCDRSVEPGRIRSQQDEFGERFPLCGHCRQRVKRPWLISRRLQAIRNNRAANA